MRKEKEYLIFQKREMFLRLVGSATRFLSDLIWFLIVWLRNDFAPLCVLKLIKIYIAYPVKILNQMLNDKEIMQNA